MTSPLRIRRPSHHVVTFFIAAILNLSTPGCDSLNSPASRRIEACSAAEVTTEVMTFGIDWSEKELCARTRGFVEEGFDVKRRR